MTNLLRLPTVLAMTSLSRSSLYLLIQQGRFPAPVKLSARSIAFSEDEVAAWIEARLQDREAA